MHQEFNGSATDHCILWFSLDSHDRAMKRDGKFCLESIYLLSHTEIAINIFSRFICNKIRKFAEKRLKIISNNENQQK